MSNIEYKVGDEVVLRCDTDYLGIIVDIYNKSHYGYSSESTTIYSVKWNDCKEITTHYYSNILLKLRLSSKEIPSNEFGNRIGDLEKRIKVLEDLHGKTI